MRSFVKIKPSRIGDITLSFTECLINSDAAVLRLQTPIRFSAFANVIAPDKGFFSLQTMHFRQVVHNSPSNDQSHIARGTCLNWSNY